ncbi:MAG: FAD-dependent oxidoreductase, partial [Lentisphaerota bacterium]
MNKGIVLVEAESFGDLGGWVIDQQFMDQMGSPYLLAHGLGKPVKDATTTVTFPETGKYKVWARTKDWVAQWKTPGAPGKFQISVDGETLETVFGTEGAAWHWQDGGNVEIKTESVKISLQDLTGFDGRCDAILFSSDAKFTPPEKPAELAVFRKKALGLPDKPEDAGSYELVVVGGGIAGVCAAISGARSGLKVAFLHDRPVLGGNNSSEARVHLGGGINLPPYPKLGTIVKEIGPLKQGNAQPPEIYEDEKKINAVKAEKNISLFLNTHAVGVEKDGNGISAVIGKDIRTGRELKFKSPLFADCTGDGAIGFLAGAEFRMGREGKDETGESIAPDKGDRVTMGSSVQWYSEERNHPASFPECPWAVQFNDENAQKVKMGEWHWETGMNRDQINEFEFVRDYGLRVVYGNWAFMKNRSSDTAKFADSELSWVAYVAGKRESRRLMGDVVLHQQD